MSDNKAFLSAVNQIYSSALDDNSANINMLLGKLKEAEVELHRLHEENKALRDRLAQLEREWVGLTDEEIDGWNIVGHESLRDFVRAIEAKLKDKNT